LLTDVVMPQMSGKQLSVKVKATHPSARVLFMTGYAEHVVAQHGVALAGERVLSKPFSTEDLLKAVRETLEDRVGKERQAAL
jgi:two-component system cell cycle sensor histidine kinase/response regulator CckA